MYNETGKEFSTTLRREASFNHRQERVDKRIRDIIDNQFAPADIVGAVNKPAGTICYAGVKQYVMGGCDYEEMLHQLVVILSQALDNTAGEYLKLVQQHPSFIRFEKDGAIHRKREEQENET